MCRLVLFLILFGAVLCANASSIAWAGGGPENLVLVVNAKSDSSKLIANYYVDRRQIPAQNVIYLTDIPKSEIITLKVFKTVILQPVLAEIQARNLGNSIDYIVYSADFPTAVIVDKHRQKLIETFKAAGHAGLPGGNRMYNPHASITAMTYFAAKTMSDDPSYIALNANYYMRSSCSSLLNRPFVGEDQDKFISATKAVAPADYAQSIETLRELAARHPKQVAVHYWLARIHALDNNPAEAAKSIAAAIRHGWVYRDYTQNDSAFEKIIDDPVFKGLVSRMPDEKFEFLPTRGFRSRDKCGPNGMINGSADQGETYVLSTVLAVTRNKGTSEKAALEQLLRSIDADGTKPRGTFYFMRTGDPRSLTRRDNFPGAIEELRRLGHRAVAPTGAMPKNKKDVAGLMMGKARYDWKKSGSSILPGAFCDNLTSTGGVLSRNTGQTVLTDFIKHGAAGSCGTVIEPFAIQAKFPHPRLHVHYAKGCSLAESVYQAVHGPFQLLVVGDALCQPWATFPQFDVTGISANQSVKDIVQLECDLSKSPVPVGNVEMYIDGRLIFTKSNVERIAFNSQTLSDGFHELRIVAVADNAIQTTSRKIIPFFVNNHGHQVTISSNKTVGQAGEKLTISAKANVGEKIILMQNMREVATSESLEASFEVPANKLGRGPVRLHAAVKHDEKTVLSAPIDLQIKGEIRSDTPKPKRRQPQEGQGRNR